MCRPMILLTISIAIPDEHTGLTHLETSAPLLAALGTAVGRRLYQCSHAPIQFGGKLEPGALRIRMR